MNGTDGLPFLDDIVKTFHGLNSVLSDTQKHMKDMGDSFKSVARDLQGVGRNLNRLLNLGLGGGGNLANAAFKGDLAAATVFTFLNKLKVPATFNAAQVKTALGLGPKWKGTVNPVVQDIDMLRSSYITQQRFRGNTTFDPKAFNDWVKAGFRKVPFGSQGGQYFDKVFKLDIMSMLKVPVMLLTATIAAVIISFKLMSAAAHSWVAMMKDTITGLATSGGRLDQMGQLKNMSAMLGMSSGQFGARARQFGDLLTGGGIPAGIAAQMGIKPYGGLGGDQNYLDKFVTAIKDVVNDPNFKRASTKARYLGLEDFMWLRDADQQHKDMVFNAQGVGMSDSDRRAAANAQAEMYSMQKQLNDAWNEFGRIALPVVITGLRWLTATFLFFINNLTVALGALIGTLTGALIGSLIPGVGTLIGGAVGGMLGGAAGAVGQHVLGQNQDEGLIVNKQQLDATRRLTDAMERNTMMQDGTYNFGDRGNNAVPRAWGMMQINYQAQGLGIALGAIAL